MTDTEITGRTERADEGGRAPGARGDLSRPSTSEALAETMTDDFINHEAPPGTPPGPASVSYFMHLLDRAFSDQKWTIEQVIVDGDLVAIRSTHSGRHTGDFFGLPATGREFSYRQMHMVRYADGQRPQSTGRCGTTPR